MLVPLNAAQVPSARGTEESDRRRRARSRRASAAARSASGPPDEKSAIDVGCFVDGGDGDRVRRVAGRADRAAAELLEVVAGRDRPARRRPRRRASIACDDDVARRLDLRLAEREVDHVHAVARPPPRSPATISGELPSRPKLARSGSSAPCSCRCTRAARRRRATAAGRRSRSCRRRRRRSRRRASRARTAAGRRAASRTATSSPAGANARATITFARRVGGAALREAGRHRVAGRVEERVRLVDAVVDDPDLDPVRPRWRGRAPELRRADQLGLAVERAVGRRRSGRPRATPGKRAERGHVAPAGTATARPSSTTGSASGPARPGPRARSRARNAPARRSMRPHASAWGPARTTRSRRSRARAARGGRGRRQRDCLRRHRDTVPGAAPSRGKSSGGTMGAAARMWRNW